MTLFGGRPRARRPAVAPWLQDLLLEGRRLVRGDAAFGDYVRTVYFAGPDALRETWAQFRESLLAEWIAARPGTRPWAWWMFDAPAARALSGASGLTIYGRDGTGVPYILEDLGPDVRLRVEAEAVTLENHALLAPEEKRRLRAAHRKPSLPSIEGRRDPATAYAADVMAGRELAGRAVRLACARHLGDIRTATERGLVWRADLAERVTGFFRDLLTLEDGSPFVLLPFQCFIVGSPFGWLTAGGTRRFRTAYVETGRGSGKTPVAAGIGLYGLVADGERSAEIYSAATGREQARICWKDAERMVAASPELREVVDPRVGSLAVVADGGIFRPVSAEHRGLDGLRVHIGISDELHEHRDSLVVDKLRTGTKTRRNALLFNITNAGFDRHSVCWNHHEYSLKVLEGAIPNDAWFAFVCGLDVCERCRLAGQRAKDCADCDSWTDERVWPKVNPALGHFLHVTYLRELVEEAKGMPTKEAIVRRLNFCEWIEGGEEKAIALDQWDRGSAPIDVPALRGRMCFGGLDLARVSDLSAFVLLFPPKESGESWKVLAWFWVPEDDVRSRSHRDRVPYDVWVRQGLIEATPGNTTDFGFIEAKVLDLAALYGVKEIAFDRTFAGEIVQGLMAEGLAMVQFGQGFLSMTAPTAELLRLVKAGQLQHGGNQVLRWMASNLSVQTDAAGNMKPDKERSSERIDGIVALCNALGRAMSYAPPPEFKSVYDERAEAGEEDVLRWV